MDDLFRKTLRTGPVYAVLEATVYSIRAPTPRCTTTHIWDPLTGESEMELRGHENAVEVIAFALLAAYAAIRELAGIPNTDCSKRSGAYVATGVRDKTIKLWDRASGQLLKNLPGHDNWVCALAFHPTGKYLLDREPFPL
ncbi:WD40-repeat-containing domain protein [Mycena leptocephala]|nr:WD40-repeat-containing domain protein [Mycena leptocephala]